VAATDALIVCLLRMPVVPARWQYSCGGRDLWLETGCCGKWVLWLRTVTGARGSRVQAGIRPTPAAGRAC